jgi:hypothetical protein
MKRLFLILLLAAVFPVSAQSRHVLKQKSGGKIPFSFANTTMTVDGRIFYLESPLKIYIAGSSGFLTLDSFSIRNKYFTAAEIGIKLTKFDSSEFRDANSYFVSLVFYDEEGEFLFGHSFVSDSGFSLGGVSADLQATAMNVEETKANHFMLSGESMISIHQAFLYGQGQSAGGIKPVHSFSIRIFHMGAG